MLKMTPPPRSVAIITNNVGCERHVQYYSNLEKYLAANDWTIAENFAVEKIVICACGFHDFMMKKVLKLLNQLSEIGFSEKNIIIAGCLPKTHEQSVKQKFNGQLVEVNQEHRLDEALRHIRRRIAVAGLHGDRHPLWKGALLRGPRRFPREP